MQQINVNILGICEIIWKYKGNFISNNQKIIYAKEEKNKKSQITIKTTGNVVLGAVNCQTTVLVKLK